MLDYLAILDAEEVIVGSWATFCICLDQGEHEIPVSNIASRIEDRRSRWLCDISDARLHTYYSVPHF